MFQTFGPNLWLRDGPAVKGAAGFWFPTRMAVVRCSDDGTLWVWSPVALTPEIRKSIDALGTVSHLVAPNSLHYTFLAEWADAFPEAIVHAAPGLTEPTAGTTLDKTLGDAPDPGWGGKLDQVLVTGNRITTEAVFFHYPSSTVIVTDLIQQIPKDWYRGWRAIVARLDLMTAPVPSVPRKFRLATTNKEAARTAIERILKWPIKQVVFAHGPPVTSDGATVVRQAFSWLLK